MEIPIVIEPESSDSHHHSSRGAGGLPRTIQQLRPPDLGESCFQYSSTLVRVISLGNKIGPERSQSMEVHRWVSPASCNLSGFELPLSWSSSTEIAGIRDDKLDGHLLGIDSGPWDPIALRSFGTTIC